MGPTCEVLLTGEFDDLLDGIDRVLELVCDRVIRTRKGRVWEVSLLERPIHVQAIESSRSVVISASCNDPLDSRLLHLLSGRLVDEFGGLASEPSK